MDEEKVLNGLVCDIYNRCSTTEEAQNRAIEVQAAESEELVAALGGTIHRQYIEQESGTSTRKRNQYASLMADVKQERIDCIVVKSIDRLMRNAGDWHEFIHLITAHKIRLYLYLERKFYEPEDAFLSGIKALIAEQYSRELSQKVNNAHRRRQQMPDGRLTLNASVFGYRKCDDAFVVDEKEARYIRKIYAMSACGTGSRRIAAELYKLGMRGRNGNAVSDVTIRRILKNPLYMGTVVMNKTHYDFEQKKTKNNPPEEWIVHENRVPPIVEEQLWQEANAALKHRSQKKGQWEQDNAKPDCVLQGKLVCAVCGSPFYRRKTGTGNYYWICGRQFRNDMVNESVCRNIPVYEKELQMVCEKMQAERYFTAAGWEELIQELLSALQAVFDGADEAEKSRRTELQRLKNKKALLMKKLLEEVIGDNDFKLANEALEQQVKVLQKQADVTAGQDKRLEKIHAFLKTTEAVKVLSESVFVAQIAQIWVKPEGELEFVRKGEDGKITVPYRHQNEKSRQKEEKIRQLYDCIVKCNTQTAEELGEQVGLSAGNVLLKLKELKRQGKLSYISKGRGGGYWEITQKDNLIKEE